MANETIKQAIEQQFDLVKTQIDNVEKWTHETIIFIEAELTTLDIMAINNGEFELGRKIFAVAQRVR